MFPFLLLPVIARYIEKSDFASFSLFLSAASFFMMLFLMGTQFELTRVYFSDRPAVKSLIRSSLFLYVILAVSSFIVLSVLPIVDVSYYSALLGLIFSFLTLALVYLRTAGKINTFGFWDTLRVSLPYLFLLGLVCFPSYNYQLWLCITLLIVAVSLLLYVLNRSDLAGSPRPESSDRHSITRLVRSGVYILPHSLSLYFLSVYDKLYIKEGMGEVHLAEYAMGFMLGQGVLLLTDAFNKGWSPHALRRLSEGDLTIMRDVKKYALLVLFVAPFVGGAIYLFARFYFPSYYNLAPVIAAFSSIAFTVQIIYFLLFPFLVHADKIKYIGAISTIATLIGGVVLTFFVHQGFLALIPVGYMVTFLVQAGGVLYVIRRVS